MGEPSAVTLLAAALGWIVLGVVPGWLVASALAPGRSMLDRLAVAPAVSVGLAYPAAAWANQLGIAVALQTGLGMLGLASAAASVVLVRRHRSGLPRQVRELDTLVAVRFPLALVLLAWLVAMATSAAGWGLVAPNSDGNAHGLFTVSVLQHGEVLGAGGYPLGVHLIAALVGAVTSVPSALVVPLTLLGSVWTVLGVASLAARVSRALVPWAAFAACLVPFFPFGQVSWGPVPLVLAVALVPGVALTVLDAAGPSLRLLATVAVAGLLAIHVTEALVAALLVVLVLLIHRRPFVRPFVAAALVGVGALVLTAPLVTELLGGGAVRPADPGLETLGLGSGDAVASAVVTSVLRPFLPAAWSDGWLWVAAVVGAAGLLVVSAVGARRVWAEPYGRAVTVLIAVLLGLGVLALAGAGGPVTSPWYRNGDRIVAQAAALLPVLLGAGLELALPRIRRGGVGAVTAVAVALCLVVALGQAVAVARQGLGRFSVVTPDDRRAFAWLASHVRPGEAVLNDHRDGSVWMVEATGGVDRPLFGAKPSGGFEADPSWDDRVYLRDHVADFGTDPRVRAVAEQWDVRYVFSGERTFADAPRLVDADALAATAGVTEVFRSGGVRVFELPAR